MSESHLRSLNLLEFMVSNPDVQTAAALAEGIGVGRATVYRMLDELIREGWVLPGEPPRQWKPSLRVAGLGLGVFVDDHRREVMFRNAVQLAAQTGGRVLLSFLEGSDCVYTDTVEVFGETVTSSLSGRRLPVACSAPGKAIIATLPDSQLEAVIANGCPRFTSKTLTTPAEIRHEVELTRDRGYGFANGEYNDDYAGVAMAVLDRSGAAVGALSIGRERKEGFEGYPQNVLEALRYYTEKASRELGYLGNRGGVLA